MKVIVGIPRTRQMHVFWERRKKEGRFTRHFSFERKKSMEKRIMYGEKKGGVLASTEALE